VAPRRKGACQTPELGGSGKPHVQLSLGRGAKQAPCLHRRVAIEARTRHLSARSSDGKSRNPVFCHACALPGCPLFRGACPPGRCGACNRCNPENRAETCITFRRSRQPPALLFAQAPGGTLLPCFVVAQSPAAAARLRVGQHEISTRTQDSWAGGSASCLAGWLAGFRFRPH